VVDTGVSALDRASPLEPQQRRSVCCIVGPVAQCPRAKMSGPDRRVLAESSTSAAPFNDSWKRRRVSSGIDQTELRQLRRSHSAHQVSARDQYQRRQGPQPTRPQLDATACQRGYRVAGRLMTAFDAVDGSSTGTRVPRIWGPLKLPWFGGAIYANSHDSWSRMRAFERDWSAEGIIEPHLKAEHIAAPTNAANMKKALVNSQPSTMAQSSPRLMRWHVRSRRKLTLHSAGASVRSELLAARLHPTCVTRFRDWTAAPFSRAARSPRSIELAAMSSRYQPTLSVMLSYRILFAPGTVASLVGWLF